MAGDVPPEESEAEGIIGAIQYDAPRPQKKEFLPWHRPRKQFVRERQWCDQIGRLLDDLQLEGAPLKYLGLPGVDLLDLRCIHSKICEPRQLRLRFLGFNSSANPQSPTQIELNISLHEVRKLGFVDPISEVIGDDFRRVANSESIAWKRTHHLGPYDVVNLDLCDGFAAQPPGTLDDNHYNAMAQLLSLQCRNKNPWLLLLTTRAGEGHVDAEVFTKLVQRFLNNIANCAEFRQASGESFGIQNQEDVAAAVQTEDGLLRVFLTSLCKWLVGMAIGIVPPWRVELKSVVGYRVDHGAAHEDLISLALRFDPTFEPVDDALDIANQEANVPDECELATKVLKRVANRRDVDQILAGDVVLNDQMVTATAELLEVARYDVAAFHAWVAAGYA